VVGGDRTQGLTQQLSNSPLVGHVLQYDIIIRGHHASHQTQAVPHLGFLVATPTGAMETVALATKTV
jgi:hypothetical protein